MTSVTEAQKAIKDHKNTNNRSQDTHDNSPQKIKIIAE